MDIAQSIPRHLEVDYHDPSHRYFLGSKTYLSATQLLEHFKNKFDKEERSQYMEYRYGNDPQYWKDKWDGKRDRANHRGHTIHNQKEDFLYGRGYDSVDGQVYRVQNRNLLPLHYPYVNLPDGVYPELKLWRHDYQIAGRADKVIIRTGEKPDDLTWEDTPATVLWDLQQQKFNGQFKGFRFMDIEDYKTNQRIRRESFYTKDPVTGEKLYRMMKGPLSHLMDCEMVHYSLQFSIYQFMGEYHGFLPGKRRMIFFRNDEEAFGGLLQDLPGETPPVVEELPYLRDEVIAMLNWMREAS
jgi:hypothetical protein